MKAIPRILKEGRSAQLGDPGTFYLTVTSTTPSDLPEGVTANSVRKINIRFRPSAEFQAEIDRAELVVSDKI